MLLVFIDHKKNPMFYTIGFIFVMVPYFRIGVSYDFCMRVSVPAIFILMLYVNDFLLKHFTLKPKTVLHAGWKTILRKACALALACCFLVGMTTPVMEVYRGFYHVLQKQTIRLEDMSIGTFSGSEVYIHFGCSNPEETFFFRYLAR